MAKTDPKTMRFDEAVFKIINEQEGKDFSDKFHKLVYDYKKSVPTLKKRKKDLQKEIEQKLEELQRLNKKIYDFQHLVNNLSCVRRDIDNAIQKVTSEQLGSH